MSARFTMQLRSTLSIRLLFTALLGVNFSVIASEVNPSMEDTATSVTTMEKQLFKVDQNGSRLPEESTEWACVEDAGTSLFWQKRDPTSALHGHDSYNWFQPSHKNSGQPRSNPELFGIDATCYGYRADDPSSYCNTDAYLQRVNQTNYCGFSDWRLPMANELLSLVDPTLSGQEYQPAIDLRYFPFNKSFAYWTNTVDEDDAVIAIFNEEQILKNLERTDHLSVRLVRGGSNPE